MGRFDYSRYIDKPEEQDTSQFDYSRYIQPSEPPNGELTRNTPSPQTAFGRLSFIGNVAKYAPDPVRLWATLSMVNLLKTPEAKKQFVTTAYSTPSDIEGVFKAMEYIDKVHNSARVSYSYLQDRYMEPYRDIGSPEFYDRLIGKNKYEPDRTLGNSFLDALKLGWSMDKKIHVDDFIINQVIGYNPGREISEYLKSHPKLKYAKGVSEFASDMIGENLLEGALAYALIPKVNRFAKGIFDYADFAFKGSFERDTLKIHNTLRIKNGLKPIENMKDLTRVWYDYNKYARKYGFPEMEDPMQFLENEILGDIYKLNDSLQYKIVNHGQIVDAIERYMAEHPDLTDLTEATISDKILQPFANLTAWYNQTKTYPEKEFQDLAKEMVYYLKTGLTVKEEPLGLGTYSPGTRDIRIRRGEYAGRVVLTTLHEFGHGLHYDASKTWQKKWIKAFKDSIKACADEIGLDEKLKSNDDYIAALRTIKVNYEARNISRDIKDKILKYFPRDYMDIQVSHDIASGIEDARFLNKMHRFETKEMGGRELLTYSIMDFFKGGSTSFKASDIIDEDLGYGRLVYVKEKLREPFKELFEKAKFEKKLRDAGIGAMVETKSADDMALVLDGTKKLLDQELIDTQRSLQLSIDKLENLRSGASSVDMEKWVKNLKTEYATKFAESIREDIGPQKGFTRLYMGQVPVDGESSLPDWIKQSDEYKKVVEEAQGRWFTDDKEIGKWYANEAGAGGIVYYVDVPTKDVAKYNVKAGTNAKFLKYSRDPAREFILPSELADEMKQITDIDDKAKYTMEMFVRMASGGRHEDPNLLTDGEFKVFFDAVNMYRGNPEGAKAWVTTQWFSPARYVFERFGITPIYNVVDKAVGDKYVFYYDRMYQWNDILKGLGFDKGVYDEALEDENNPILMALYHGWEGSEKYYDDIIEKVVDPQLQAKLDDAIQFLRNTSKELEELGVSSGRLFRAVYDDAGNLRRNPDGTIEKPPGVAEDAIGVISPEGFGGKYYATQVIRRGLDVAEQNVKGLSRKAKEYKLRDVAGFFKKTGVTKTDVDIPQLRARFEAGEYVENAHLQFMSMLRNETENFFMEPAYKQAREMVSKIGGDAERYVSNWINYAHQGIPRGLDSWIEGPAHVILSNLEKISFGHFKEKSLAARQLLDGYRRGYFTATMGFNPGPVMTNAGQVLLTIPSIGWNSTLAGYQSLIHDGGQESLKHSMMILQRGIPLHEINAKGLTKVERLGTYAFQAVDTWLNCSVAYNGSLFKQIGHNADKISLLRKYGYTQEKYMPTKAKEFWAALGKALDAGEFAAEKLIADDIAKVTQFSYLPHDLPQALWSASGKALGQFATWPMNYWGQFIPEMWRWMKTGNAPWGEVSGFERAFLLRHVLSTELLVQIGGLAGVDLRKYRPISFPTENESDASGFDIPLPMPISVRLDAPSIGAWYEFSPLIQTLIGAKSLIGGSEYQRSAARQSLKRSFLVDEVEGVPIPFFPVALQRMKRANVFSPVGIEGNEDWDVGENIKTAIGFKVFEE